MCVCCEGMCARGYVCACEGMCVTSACACYPILPHPHLPILLPPSSADRERSGHRGASRGGGGGGW